MTPDLDTLEALLREATPGPWCAQKFPDGRGWVQSIVDGYEGEMRFADAALIVAAVNALPDLIARLREAEAALEQERADHKRGAEMVMENMIGVAAAETDKARAVREAWEAAAKVCDERASSRPMFMGPRREP